MRLNLRVQCLLTYAYLSLSLPLHPEGLSCADGLWDLYNYRVCAGKDSGFRRFMGLRADRGKVSGFMR